MTVDDIDPLRTERRGLASGRSEVQKDLNIPSDEKLNGQCGAIAMGHPLWLTNGS